MPAVEHSKSFITSIVVGKDVVPRVGLHQMEAMRADLINAIQRRLFAILVIRPQTLMNLIILVWIRNGRLLLAR